MFTRAKMREAATKQALISKGKGLPEGFLLRFMEKLKMEEKFLVTG
jgi:hypothetical protein